MKISGATSGCEVDTAMSLIRNHPDLPNMKYAIADYLDVDIFLVTTYDILIIASHDHWISKTNPRLKIALVGNRADILETFHKYASSAVIANTFLVRIFGVLDEARNWVST
jgi:hypothetical protein